MYNLKKEGILSQNSKKFLIFSKIVKTHKSNSVFSYKKTFAHFVKLHGRRLFHYMKFFNIPFIRNQAS